MADNFQRISGAFGSAPVESGAGTKTFDATAYAYEVWEDTVISHFYDDKGNVVITGWEGKPIDTQKGPKTIFFGFVVKSMQVSTGGLGQYFRSEHVK